MNIAWNTAVTAVNCGKEEEDTCPSTKLFVTNEVQGVKKVNVHCCVFECGVFVSDFECVNSVYIIIKTKTFL